MNYDNWKLSTPEDEMSYSEEEIDRDYYTSCLERDGAESVEVYVDNYNKTIELSFDYDGVFYRIEELDVDSFEELSFKNLLNEADETETSCCGANYDSDHRRCFHCKEAF